MSISDLAISEGRKFCSAGVERFPVLGAAVGKLGAEWQPHSARHKATVQYSGRRGPPVLPDSGVNEPGARIATNRAAPPRFASQSANDDIGALQKRWRDRESKPACCDEVDGEYELRGLFDRQILRMRSAQNFVDVLGGAPENRVLID